jgi:mRNA-degrading endonuclease RelE of RelBE toxin-antitoxin system
MTRTAARALASRLPEKIAVAVHEFVTGPLLDNPQRLGKRLLQPPFEGTWSARRGAYRVLYVIEEEERVVLVTSIEHRSDAYRSRRGG